MILLFSTFLISLSSLILSSANVNYNQAVYLEKYQNKLADCLYNVGYFSCENLGEDYKELQDCFVAIQNFDQCLKDTCYDAEYIELQKGVMFDYSKEYYDYAMVESGNCLSRKIVQIYSRKSQSTQNYLEEVQKCYFDNKFILDPNARLTDLQSTLKTCIKLQEDCNQECQNFSESFNKCALMEEEQFTIKKSFWNIHQFMGKLKEKSYYNCVRTMQREKPRLRDQDNQYLTCVLTNLNSFSSLFSFVPIVFYFFTLF